MFKPLMPGGNKKVKHTYTHFVKVCVTSLLPPGIKGLKYISQSLTTFSNICLFRRFSQTSLFPIILFHRIRRFLYQDILHYLFHTFYSPETRHRSQCFFIYFTLLLETISGADDR